MPDFNLQLIYMILINRLIFFVLTYKRMSKLVFSLCKKEHNVVGISIIYIAYSVSL